LSRGPRRKTRKIFASSAVAEAFHFIGHKIFLRNISLSFFAVNIQAEFQHMVFTLSGQADV